MGEQMRPDVAQAFDRMAAAARKEAGLYLSITSAFRSDAEHAKLFAANPNPKWVAPSGTSLHRYATELDLGPPPPTGGLRQIAGASASFTDTRGRIGITASASIRATVSTRLATTRGRGSRPAAIMAAFTIVCPASCRRASTTRSLGRRCAGTFR
jgi:D-alanyl-D-alanine carboxypeptidase